MRKQVMQRSSVRRYTQLSAIRDLMFAAAQRGAWLTLGEIARLTEFGEASVSAQLRHLRKLRHGRHRVEKRVRRLRTAAAEASRAGHSRGKSREAAPTLWEYRVSTFAARKTFARAQRPDVTVTKRSTDPNAPTDAATDLAGFAAAPQGEQERVHAMVMQSNGEEVRDAEART